jgi:hypothetical protein
MEIGPNLKEALEVICITIAISILWIAIAEWR